MSSAVFPRQPSVLVMLIFLDGNEYREGKDYGQQEERDTDDNDEDRVAYVVLSCSFLLKFACKVTHFSINIKRNKEKVVSLQTFCSI